MCRCDRRAYWTFTEIRNKFMDIRTFRAFALCIGLIRDTTCNCQIQDDSVFYRTGGNPSASRTRVEKHWPNVWTSLISKQKCFPRITDDQSRPVWYLYWSYETVANKNLKLSLVLTLGLNLHTLALDCVELFSHL